MEIAGSTQATIAATAQDCFAVLVDYERYPEWWPGCTEARLVTGAPPAEHEVELVFDTASPVGMIDVRLRFHSDPPTRLRPELVGGRLQRLGGDGWTLSEHDQVTVATYALEGALATGLPSLVERPFRSRARELLIERPVRALKARVERG